MNTLDEFTSKERQLIWRFKSYWETRSEISPANFPMEMDEAGWSEQFEFFKAMEDRNG